ncbi:MAG TPA: RNA polymerase sigma-54 factor, partial [Tenacibaculum sp.]|nr:RNA polymerase sigma-54 factor [Tenacibaculum sp.]
MLKQSLHQKLLQKLSPQQIQLMKLIQLPTQAFEERLKQEIEENPALDTGKEENDNFEDSYSNDTDYDDTGNEKIEAEDINIDEYLSDDEFPSYKMQSNNYSSDDDEKHIPYAAGTSFHQSLKNQLNTFRIDDSERAIAEFLVGSIDDSGYIRRELLDLVDDLAFTQNIFTTEEKVKDILTKVVQKLDPIGVGALNLKDCLIIQLNSKPETKYRSLAIKILNESFDHF